MALSGDAKVKRFSVSLPPALVEEFDYTWMGMKYESRSKAVHDAFRGFISDVKWMSAGEGGAVGVVMVLHYVERTELIGEINRIQRRYSSVIKSVQQLFVGDNKMLAIVAVEGRVADVKGLTEELMALKGVKHVKTSFITI